MFRLPMQVGLAPVESTPPGWHYWKMTAVTPRMRRHARMLSGESLPDRAKIVRAVPGHPADGLLALCEGLWPVSAEEIEAERRARADYATRDIDDATAAESIQGRDPQHDGYAACAPAHLTFDNALLRGAEGLYSSYHSGRIRWTPGGWLIDEGWHGSTRTLPGRPFQSAGEAAEKLLAHMQARYIEGVRAIQAGAGDVGWQAYAPILGAYGVPRRLVLSAEYCEHHAAGFSLPRTLASIVVPAPRWADHVKIQPAAGAHILAGIDECLCPDCGGHLRADSPAHARCKGLPVSGSEQAGWQYAPGAGCGSYWYAAERDGWIVLARVNLSQIGRTIGDVDISPLARAVVPDAETRVAEHRARKQAADSAAAAAEESALSAFRSHPALAPYCERRGLKYGARINLRNGLIATAIGPVRIGADDGAPQALVALPPTHGREIRTWMALLEFV